MYEFKGKRLIGSLLNRQFLISLIICLLGRTSQFAQSLYFISLRVACVQDLYCLVPAFFLILMLNCLSATLIISL